VVADETGSVKLTLWNEQIDQVNVGDNIKIDNGYVTSFKGEIQLNVGKFGKLAVE
jgi:replication factor A1